VSIPIPSLCYRILLLRKWSRWYQIWLSPQFPNSNKHPLETKRRLAEKARRLTFSSSPALNPKMNQEKTPKTIKFSANYFRSLFLVSVPNSFSMIYLQKLLTIYEARGMWSLKKTRNQASEQTNSSSNFSADKARQQERQERIRLSDLIPPFLHSQNVLTRTTAAEYPRFQQKQIMRYRTSRALRSHLLSSSSSSLSRFFLSLSLSLVACFRISSARWTDYRFSIHFSLGILVLIPSSECEWLSSHNQTDLDAAVSLTCFFLIGH
jgi:hypothetical protein